MNMKMNRIITIMLISLLLTMSYTDIANGDIFNTLKIRHTDRPNICIFEPDPEITDNWDQFKISTLMGIYEWEIKLNKMYPDGDWKMVVQTISWEEHENKSISEYKYCNIMINFEKENLKSNAVGTTSIQFNNSHHKYMFINVYLEHSASNSITIDGSEGTFKISVGKIILTPNVVRNVVLHEIGHSLGLLHFEFNTPLKVGERGIDRSAMYYSIKINDKNEILTLKIPDIQMIKELYGEDGWVGMTPPWNIRSCMVTGDITYNCR